MKWVPDVGTAWSARHRRAQLTECRPSNPSSCRAMCPCRSCRDRARTAPTCQGEDCRSCAMLLRKKVDPETRLDSPRAHCIVSKVGVIIVLTACSLAGTECKRRCTWGVEQVQDHWKSHPLINDATASWGVIRDKVTGQPGGGRGHSTISVPPHPSHGHSRAPTTSGTPETVSRSCVWT